MPRYGTKRNNKHLRDLNGTWFLSKTLSTGVPPALALQGLNSSTRKAFIASPLKLWISQSNYPSQIFVKQFPTAASLPEQTEKLYPPQKIGRWAEWCFQRSGVLGDVKSRCRWVRGRRSALDDAADSRSISTAGGSSTADSGVSMDSSREIDPVVEEFLMEDVKRLGECEFLEVELDSLEAAGGWTARQVWVVDGMDRLVRRVVTWGRDGKRAETRLVYEFDG